MNQDPDYSAAYLAIRTDDGRSGNSLVFTIGRGNDIQVAAVAALAPLIVGRRTEDLVGDLGGAARALVRDSQFRWLGPEKGIMHMAIGAVVNALWDLAARIAGMPLWRFLASMTPAELVGLIDFRHISDELSPDQALDLFRAQSSGRAERIAILEQDGFEAYATSPGWLGYSDSQLRERAAAAVADGYGTIKLKVGNDLRADQRRLSIAREVIGPDIGLAIDANQVWDVDQAIAHVRGLAFAQLRWIEEPTSPDDMLGHARIRREVAPVPVATGEHMHNRVMCKQFLQADALDVLQIDAARVGGVNELVAMVAMAARRGIPVCPHAGGVGLCEMVQHVAMFDFVAVSGSQDGAMIEYVDHLHEHFVDPVTIKRGRYLAPTQPGMSAEMHEESLKRFSFPGGEAWRS
jgi:L-fuconate dehydratase